MPTCVYMCHGMFVETREQCEEVYSFLPPCEIYRPNSGPQASWVVPFPSMPSFWSTVPSYISELSPLRLEETKCRKRTFIDLIINHFHPFWPSMVSSLCLPYTVIMVLKSVPLYLVSWIFRCLYLVILHGFLFFSLCSYIILFEMFEMYCFSYFSIGTYIADYCHFFLQ